MRQLALVLCLLGFAPTLVSAQTSVPVQFVWTSQPAHTDAIWEIERNGEIISCGPASLSGPDMFCIVSIPIGPAVFRLRGVNSLGAGDWSASQSATIPGGGGGGGPPGTFTITWDQVPPIQTGGGGGNVITVVQTPDVVVSAFTAGVKTYTALTTLTPGDVVITGAENGSNRNFSSVTLGGQAMTPFPGSPYNATFVDFGNWWRRVDGTESGQDVVVTLSGSDGENTPMGCVVIRGLPADFDPQSVITFQDAMTSFSVGPVTPTYADNIIIVWNGRGNRDWSATPAEGFTHIGTPGAVYYFGYKIQTAATASTKTFESDVNSYGHMVISSLNGEASGGLALPAIASSAALFVPTILSDLPLTGSTISSSSAVYLPSLALNLLLSTVSAGSAVLPATVSPGALELTPPAISSTVSTYAPTVSPGAATVALPAIASGAATYTPALHQNLATGTVGASNTVFAPALAYAVAAPSIDSLTGLFAPTVTPGAVTIEPGTVASTAQIYSATVSAGGNSLSLPIIPSTTSVSAPTLVQNLITEAIPSTSTVFTPSLAQVLELGTISSDASVFPGTVSPGAITLGSPTIASSATVHVPIVLAGGNALLATTIASTVNLFTPSVQAADIGLSLPVVSSTVAVYAPNVGSQASLSLPTVSSTTVVSAPEVKTSLYASYIGSTTQLFGPSLEYTILLPSISSTDTLFTPSLNRYLSTSSVAISTSRSSSIGIRTNNSSAVSIRIGTE